MATNFNFTKSGYVPSSNFNFSPPFFTYNNLAGASNSFVAIWADPTASRTNGKFQASSAEAFSVVNLSDGSLYDFYTTTHAGMGEEALESDTVIDINIV